MRDESLPGRQESRRPSEIPGALGAMEVSFVSEPAGNYLISKVSETSVLRLRLLSDISATSRYAPGARPAVGSVARTHTRSPRNFCERWIGAIGREVPCL